jgi:hypothetical protein
MFLKAVGTELPGVERMKKSVLKMIFIVMLAWRNVGTAF